MAFELPDLPYPYDALEPYMSSRTLHLHHDKHHQTYVTNLNNLIEDTDLKKASLEEIVAASAKDPAKAGDLQQRRPGTGTTTCSGGS